MICLILVCPWGEEEEMRWRGNRGMARKSRGVGVGVGGEVWRFVSVYGGKKMGTEQVREKETERKCVWTSCTANLFILHNLASNTTDC